MSAEPQASGPDEERKKRREQSEAIRSSLRDAQKANWGSWAQEVHSQVPRPLWHYTTAKGLDGMISNNSIWASDVRYMNDASELSYAASLIGEEIANATRSIGDSRLQPGLENIQKFNIFEYAGFSPFCACFCEKGDLLSQWRGYAAGQIGYSLGLELGDSFILDLPRNTILRKVVYNEDEQRSWTRRITESWLNGMSTLLDSEDGITITDLFPYPAIWTLQEALVEQYLCFKHPGFSEEQEWRLIKLIDIRAELDLVVRRQSEARLEQLGGTLAQQGIKIPPLPPSRPQTSAGGIEIEFRQSSLGFIPYIELSLKHSAGVFAGKLPLGHVKQGPTSNVALSLESLVMFLRSHGFMFPITEVSVSTIPLR
jgi:hypothetical protein